MRILAVCLIAALGGCAQPVLDIAAPKEHHKAAATTVLASNISPNRNLARAEMTPAVARIIERVRASAYAHCVVLDLPEERCGLMMCSERPCAMVTVYSDEPGINALADARDEVSLFGGLVSNMGSDEEIAAVLAHELAHVMFGHVEKKQKNALAGALVAQGLAGFYGGATGTDPTAYQESWVRTGFHAGARAYSPAMEIEADRAAIYILKGAGFDPRAMRDVIVRMSQMQLQAKSGRFTGTVGFLETHPSDDRRIAHILSAIEDVESGLPLKKR